MWFILAIVICFTVGNAHAAETASGKLPTRRTQVVFTRSESDTLFELPNRWVDADSIRIQKNGSWLEPLRDYRIIAPGHFIWLYSPLSPGDTLVIDYVYSPISLSRTYARRSLRELTHYQAKQDSAAPPIVFQNEPTTSAWSSLRRNGSLVRSVQIGTNQDLAFESALSLQVEGKVGSNVDVVAALSDQNLPIQPEGTSESIRELDKVYVTARSPHFEATIGDYEFELSGRRYYAYSRKLSGLNLGATTHGVNAILSAAISRGEFHTNRFSGAESIQGPYPLTGKNSEMGIIVLAGTETVWLDGAVQRRGEDNDYIIDYAAGQITFSSRRLITSDSRIIVEFEYSNEDYERQYWATRTGASSDHLASGAYVTYVAERDDRARPLGFTIDNESVSAIENAGDSVGFAFSSSADSLGQGLGDYVRRDTVVAGTLISVFAYVPPSAEGKPQGQWQVFFDDFGTGQGDYEAAADEFGRTYFYFVGERLGRYRAARRIPLPTSQELIAFRLDRPATQGFRSNFEIAMSNLDRNNYSELDDADNQGIASALEFGYNRPEFQIGKYRVRQFAASAEGRVRESTFTDIARSDDIEFDRDWAGSSVREATEIVGQGNIGFSPVKSVNVSGSSGLLSRGEAFTSRRFGVTSSYQSSRKTSLRVEHISILSEDSTNARETDWIRQRVEANTFWKLLAPRFKLNRERQLRDSRLSEDGFRFSDGSLGNVLTLSRSLQLDADAGLRQDDVRRSGNRFEKQSDAKSYSSEVRWSPVDLGRGSLRWVHRDKSFESGDSASISSDAGRLELLMTPRSRIFELNILYDALKSRTEQQIQIFIPTEPGQGNYRLENGVYVPDDQGNYVLVSRNTANFEPSSEIKTSGLFWFRPDEARADEKTLWQRFAFETEATLEEQTRLPITLGLLLLDRGKLRSSETIDGRFSLRQDIHINRLSRDVSFRIRGVNSAAQVSRYTNGAQETIRREGSIRARIRYLSNLRGESEFSSELERSVYEGVSIASTDVTRQSGKQDVVWTITDRWEAGLQFIAGESKDERSQTQASVREIAPRASYSSFRKGRVDSELHWIHVSSNRSRLPQDLAGGSNRGENYRWSLRITIALSNNFTSSLNYTGRRDSGEETVNIGRVEVRATF
ncbi:MAG: hypothetical protein IPP40_01170 [bacterium]|nr:hypothetical protein [bacterium]